MADQGKRENNESAPASPTQVSSVEVLEVVWMGVRFVFYSLLIVFLLLCITWEAHHAPHETLFSENSLLEYFQEAMLLLTVILIIFINRIDPGKKSLAWILGGAALVAWIREFDFFLDAYVFDGAWQMLVIITLIIIVIRLFPLRRSLLPIINEFIKRKSFGIIFSGFLTVFVFSRMFGRNVFWEAVTGEHSIRAVKNAAEEGTELFGYLLIFVGVMELLAECYRMVKKNRMK